MSKGSILAIEQAVKDLDDNDVNRVLSFIESIKPRKRAVSASAVDRIVDSLVGSVPDDGMTEDDYRCERLSLMMTRV